MIVPSTTTAQFQYAIPNIVSAARVLERNARRVTYLNFGDSRAFGRRRELSPDPRQHAASDAGVLPDQFVYRESIRVG